MLEYTYITDSHNSDSFLIITPTLILDPQWENFTGSTTEEMAKQIRKQTLNRKKIYKRKQYVHKV